MRPHAGPYGTAKAGLRQEAEAPPAKPSRSWWLDTAKFYENAKEEQKRLRGSQGERMAQQVLSAGAERYLGKLGG